MSCCLLLTFTLLLLLSPAGAQTASGAASASGRVSSLTGTFATHPQFHSRFLPDDRDVLVYLPPDYATNKQTRYPVLYLHDGQNVFDGATSFIPNQEWRADETAQQLILSKRIRPLIIVGVYNSAHRMDDYTPTRITRDGRSFGGQADAYGKMLTEELKPFIDSHYRTLHGPRDTGLCGSSLGGLNTLYLGLRYPNVFGQLGVVSPSVWWGSKTIVRDVQAYAQKPSARIWLDIGTAEDRDAKGSEETVQNTADLRDALVGKGWKLNRNLMYTVAEGEHHSETAWAKRFGPMLEFLFPAHAH